MREKPILFKAPLVRAILAGRKTQTRRLLDLSRAHGEPVAGPGEVLDLIYPGARCHYGWVPKEHDRTAWLVQRLCSEACEPSPDGVYPRTGHVDWRGPVDGYPGPYDGRHPVAWGPLPFWPGLRLWVRETFNWAADDELLPGENHRRCTERAGYRAENVVWAADGVRKHPEHGKALWRPSIHMPRWASRITLEVTEVRVQRLNDITEEDARAEGLALEGLIQPGHAHNVFAKLWDEINYDRAPWTSNPWVAAVSFRRLP